MLLMYLAIISSKYFYIGYYLENFKFNFVNYTK